MGFCLVSNLDKLRVVHDFYVIACSDSLTSS